MSIASKHLINHYLDDLIKNQKLNVAKAIGPIRTVVNVSGAIISLIQTPYQAYREERGFMRGLNQGVWEFYSKIAEEGGYLLGSKNQ